MKIRGFRIELGEIESTLADLPDVKQVVVIDRERDGNKYLAAYLVTESDVPIDEEQLRESLATKLPEYMVPSTFTFIEALPLTINGKLDRLALPEPTFVNSNTYMAPRNELEAKLCSIWQDVLGLEKISIYDNFFYIGGNSITATKVISTTNRTFKTNLSVATIFVHPKISYFSEEILRETKNFSCLKNLTPFSRSKDTLFMVHPGSGGCEVYLPLASKLANKLNCVGIDNYYFTSEKKELSLREISKIYTGQIIDKFPELKKFQFIGWSLGGQIAMEISYQLEKIGIKDINIYLLDTIIPDTSIMELSDKMYDDKKFQEGFKNYLVERGYDEKYIEMSLSVRSLDRKIFNSPLSGVLEYTKITLLKAGKETPLIDKVIQNKLYRIVLSLPDNNISQYTSGKLSTILFENNNHGNIIDEVQSIKNIIIKDH